MLGQLGDHPLPVETQVLIALRFYESGGFQNAVSVHQSSVSRAITSVTEALYQKGLREIKIPNGLPERSATIENFASKAIFHKVLGAIDDTHIAIKAPSVNEHLFVNRKGYHSLNCKVVSDSQNTILNCVARYPISTHD